jgi:peptidoglycan/LPS O-acetylase OafA/YrhL
VSTRAPAATRLGGLDSLKGIAIALVVAIHAAPSAAPEYQRIVIAGIARLAVPLFLVMSGYLIGSRPPPQAKLAGYFWKFLRLHLIYGAFYWALEPLSAGHYRALSPKNALMHFAAFAYPGQYYLFVLPQIYLLFGFLIPERRRSQTGLLLASLLLSAGCIALLAASVASGSAAPPPGIVAGHAEASFVLWLFAFCAGVWVGARERSFARLGGAGSLLLLAAAAGLAVFELPRTDGAAYLERFAYARWSILIGTALMAAALPWAAHRLRLPPFEALGRESFGIFVFNPAILFLLARAVGQVETLPRSLAYLAVTLAVAYGLARTLRPRLPIAFP